MSKNNDIKAIVWDVDGVLLRQGNGTAHMESAICAESNPEKHKLWREKLWDGRFEPCLIGADTPKMLADTIDEVKADLSVEDVLNAWLNSAEDVQHEAIEIIGKIGYPQHFLGTNQCPIRGHYIWEDLAFKNHFREMFASGHLGVRKPERAFFAKAHEGMTAHIPGILPEEVLFFDDLAENVSAAEEFGWCGECYTAEKFDDLPGILRQYGIAF